MIHTCDKFSDLWDTHIQLLDKNWAERDVSTLLVTDKNTDRTYDGIQLICVGEEKELPQRTEAALDHITTEYVLITLDDYFPIYKIDSAKIERLLDIMDAERLDYIRLFCDPNSHKKYPGYDKLYKVVLDRNYQVNLYQGIWRKSFIKKTIGKSLNAWQYEVSLTKIAKDFNTKCALSKGKEFEILDVVRKGKLLHKAARYLKKHDLYHGPREVITWKAEMKINFMAFLKRHTPLCFINFLKKIMIKHGHKFYSNVDVG